MPGAGIKFLSPAAGRPVRPLAMQEKLWEDVEAGL